MAVDWRSMIWIFAARMLAKSVNSCFHQAQNVHKQIILLDAVIHDEKLSVMNIHAHFSTLLGMFNLKHLLHCSRNIIYLFFLSYVIFCDEKLFF